MERELEFSLNKTIGLSLIMHFEILNGILSPVSRYDHLLLSYGTFYEYKAMYDFMNRKLEYMNDIVDDDFEEEADEPDFYSLLPLQEESIGFMKIFESRISTDLHVLRVREPEKHVFTK